MSASHHLQSPELSFLKEYLEMLPDGCPRLRVPGGLLSINGEIALGYLDLGYRPVPLIQDSEGNWIPTIPWKPFQSRAPTRQDIVACWRRYPNAGIALIYGRDAGLVVLNIDPRHGGIDPKLSVSACSTPRGGVHYHFVAPAPIPELDGSGLEWLGDCHIARVPPTPSYRWLNGGLPPRRASYEPEELLQASRPRMPSPAATPQGGDLCEILSHALGRALRPGSTIHCFCHDDKAPSLGIYPDHAFCFSQKKSFTPHQVLEGLGLAHLVHIEEKEKVYETNAHEGSTKSTAPGGVKLAEEKQRLAKALEELGFADKAKEVRMCGQWITRRRDGFVRTRTCQDCGATFVTQSRCHSRFCPECAAIEARESLRGKSEIFKSIQCAIIRLPLPHLQDNTARAFSELKKEVLGKLRRLLGRGCAPAYHKILTGCRNGEFRWELVVLASEEDATGLKSAWSYGNADILRELTPAQATALFCEVVSKPPQWETPEDLLTLDMIVHGQRLRGSHGAAHGNSKEVRKTPRVVRTPQRCPLCGSTNLSRPVYRDTSGVQWVNGIPLWFPPPSRASPP